MGLMDDMYLDQRGHLLAEAVQYSGRENERACSFYHPLCPCTPCRGSRKIDDLCGDVRPRLSAGR